ASRRAWFRSSPADRGESHFTNELSGTSSTGRRVASGRSVTGRASSGVGLHPHAFRRFVDLLAKTEPSKGQRPSSMPRWLLPSAARMGGRPGAPLPSALFADTGSEVRVDVGRGDLQVGGFAVDLRHGAVV